MKKLSLSLEPFKLPILIELQEAEEIFKCFVLPQNESTGSEFMWLMVYLGIDQDRILGHFKPYIDSGRWSQEKFLQKYQANFNKKNILELDLEKKKYDEAKKYLLNEDLSGLTFSEEDIEYADDSFLLLAMDATQEQFNFVADEELKIWHKRSQFSSHVKFCPPKRKTESKQSSRSTTAPKIKPAASPKPTKPEAFEGHQSSYLWAIKIDSSLDQGPQKKWLVEGLLMKGGQSVIYGEPAAGKTYIAIDLAVHIARGVDWMDRKIEKGQVLYVAAERPDIAMKRLNFYRNFLGIDQLDIYLYKKPFDLYTSTKDADELINFVVDTNGREATPLTLIIFDTLAKIMVGANENLSSDMGKVVSRLDQITAKTKAHCMVVHHSGKDRSKGARGSNSLLGAIDTELEIIKSKVNRFIEVTKQREGEEGQRIGFELKHFDLTSDGVLLSSCIVQPSATSQVTKAVPKVNKVKKAILTELENSSGMTKTEFVKSISHRVGHTQPNQVYKQLSELVSNGSLFEFDKDGNRWVSLSRST